MNPDDPEARRLALALLRLRESGDSHGTAWLAGTLDAEQARAVLLAQTENASVMVEGLFRTIVESRLPMLAAEYDRTPHQVVDDHLGRLILRLAAEEEAGP
jgi:hypothetical protein